MAEQWTMTRLRKSTVERLRAMRSGIAARDGGTETYNPGDPDLWLSVDALIVRLLDDRDAHARRRRASGGRRRQRQTESPSPDAGTAPPVPRTTDTTTEREPLS